MDTIDQSQTLPLPGRGEGCADLVPGKRVPSRSGERGEEPIRAKGFLPLSQPSLGSPTASTRQATVSLSPSKGRGRVFRLVFSAASALALAACAVGPNYAPPATPSTAAGQFVSANSPALSNDPAASNWWRLYQDPVLDGLIADALKSNTDIRVAVAHLEKARASLRGARSDRLPSTGLDVAFGIATATPALLPGSAGP